MLSAEQESSGQSLSALHALTAAALALPGLMQPGTSSAQDNAAVVQFGRYGETSRDLYGVTSKFAPIQADSLQGSAWFTVTDRLKGLVNFSQDTWSGATPIATAPLEWHGNRSRAPDGVSGASPYLVPPSLLFLDKNTLQPLRTDGFGNLTGGVDTQLVHTISGASTEIRKQIDFNFRRDWDETALDFGGGVSSEPDYHSTFVGGGGRWDFNQKLTTVNLGTSYTWSSTSAVLDHDATPYIYNVCGTATCNFVSSTSRIENSPGGKKTLYGDRHDWGVTAGLTQILNENAQVNTNLVYTRSSGYLSNPYKVVEVAFIDPTQQFLSPSPDALYVNVNSLLDQRPNLRNQWLWNIRFAQYVDSSQAGLHLNYAYFRDDWGIRAHTFEVEWAQPFGNGWMVTPMFRYYTQSAAYFYVPYLVTDQAQYTQVVDPVTGRVNNVPFDRSKLPPYYSSDYRLSGYGALAGGVSVKKTFSKGVNLYLGYVYYERASGFKAGGGGAGSYTDFSSHLVNASLVFDMDAAGSSRLAAQSAGHEAHVHESHSGATAPAGVMFAHTLAAAGDWMAGVRYAYSRQSGPMLHGSSAVDDRQIKSSACGTDGCLTTPNAMSMNMYMLELMYAPTDWLTLMLMPQYMDMSMNMRGLLTSSEQAALPPDKQALYQHHTLHGHTSGGVGDTGIYAMVKLLDEPGNQVIGTLGVTAPTGSVDVRLRDTHQLDAGLDHYGMQLGSGTWDLNPSLTYTGAADDWFWGAQLVATVRLQDRNASGYALGDVYQSSLWGGYRWDERTSTTVRGVYTSQGAIRGEMNGTFRKMSPVDYTSNYGGRYWDLGIGLSYSLGGLWAGNQVSVEYVLPLKDDVNGYQLERRGALYATWQYMF